MRNQALAKLFYELADFLEMDSIAFKPYAYRRAAQLLETLELDVGQVYLEGGVKALQELPGIGQGIAERIEEFLKTGKIKLHEQYKKRLPVKFDELAAIEGLGAKRIKVLYKKLGVKNLKNLEKAAKAHKIAPLFGFGQKTEQNILQGLEFMKKSKGRFLLGQILPLVKEYLDLLRSFKEVEELEVAGSVRRWKETIGDVDILVVTKKPEMVVDFFCKLPGITKIWGKGPSKASVHLKDGFDLDLRVIPKESYGAALQYFTGSKEHNIKVRKIAMERGLKLNEYGLFRGNKKIAGRTEKEIYEALGMEMMAPEIREDQGEVEAALKGQLPKIIGYNDIKGDLHYHSNWDGGKESIEQMAKAAIAMGYEYVGVSDHTKFLRIEKGLDEQQLLEQRKEIDKVNSELRALSPQFHLLHGCEANILNDGSLDIKDDVLAKLDYVIAGVHSNLKMPKSQMTKRIIIAMKNPNVDVISHPTGRILKQRDPYEVDLDKILQVAKETGTILEINSSPERLDLNDQNIRRAKEAGVLMLINTDSHHHSQLRFMEYGIAQARRGWAGKEDIVNTRPIDKLLKAFK